MGRNVATILHIRLWGWIIEGDYMLQVPQITAIGNDIIVELSAQKINWMMT